MNQERPLYLITDGGDLRQRGQLQFVIEQVVSALGKRIFALQIREQVGAAPASDDEVVTLARNIRGLTSASGIRLFISRRLDLALLAKADGVHLGFRSGAKGSFDDTELLKVRQAGLLAGMSVHSAADALVADAARPDYVFLSPIFQTISKKMRDRLALGEDILRDVCGSIDIPVFALGGVFAGNARSALVAGAAGVAVIGSGLAANDPVMALEELLAEIAK